LSNLSSGWGKKEISAPLLPNIDQVDQGGWGLTIKLRALGGTSIELSKKQPLFVCRLSIFLSFESLKNLGIPPEEKMFGGS
jgi:hypothetical protein